VEKYRKASATVVRPGAVEFGRAGRQGGRHQASAIPQQSLPPLLWQAEAVERRILNRLARRSDAGRELREAVGHALQ
jgi:hypothetical protein